MSEERCGDRGPNGVALCTNPPRHIEEHYDVKLAVSWPKELCAAKQSAHSLDSCKLTAGHAGRHTDPDQGASWPKEPVSPPQLGHVIPHAVRARVELHRAQTAYDLTVLRANLDTITVSTAESRRLRARRVQLTAELDAWAYLAKMARSPG